MSEALAIVQGDRTTLNVVMQRECTTAPTAEELELCLRQVVAGCERCLRSVNERTQTALTRCAHSSSGCRDTPTPKTIVFISEGLLLERAGRQRRGWAGGGRGQVTLYVLQLEAFASEASTRTSRVAPDRQGARAGGPRHPRRSRARRRASASSATPTSRSSASASSCPATTS